MSSLANAYVQIIPSADGISGSIQKVLDPEATSAGKSGGEKMSTGFVSAVGKMGVLVAKGVGVAVGAAAAGVTALTKSAIGAYSEYEQLKGGTELMFGEASDFIMKRSLEAYKTVQMSQNDYLTQVNGFAVGLKTALGGNEKAAAELSNKIVQAEADIVAATGNTSEAVQNAFNGIMKGNYTMLDNLQIGITPTKQGFQEVIDKVNEWNAANGNATKYQIDNLADCQSALVDYIDMVGMSGYAQAEAADTIQGSLSSMKGAWSNLLTGMADSEADLSQLTQNLIDTIVGYADENGKHVNGFVDNIIPVIETSLSSIGTLIKGLLPQALELIPALINDVLPDIMEAATGLVDGLVSSLSDNMDTISEVINKVISAIVGLLPDFMSLGGEIISTLASAIMDNLGDILQAASQILMMLLKSIKEHTSDIASGAEAIIRTFVEFITGNIDALVEVAASMIKMLSSSFSLHIDEIINSAITIVMTIAQALLDNLPTLLDAGLTLFLAIAEGLLEAIPQIIEYLPELIDSILGALTQSLPLILNAGIELFMALVEALPVIIEALVEALPTVIDSVIDTLINMQDSLLDAAIKLFTALVDAIPKVLPKIIAGIIKINLTIAQKIIEAVPKILAAGIKLLGKIAEAVPDAVKKLKGKMPQIINAIVSGLKAGLAAITGIGGYLMTGLWNGIRDKVGWVKSQIRGMGSQIISAIKGVFGVASPSREFAKIGRFLAEGLGVGWNDEIQGVMNDMNAGLTGSLNSGMSLIDDSMNELSDRTYNPFDTGLLQDSTSPRWNGNDVTEDMTFELLEKMYLLCQKYFPEFSQDMVLDTGVLVASTAPAMSERLGLIKSRRNRA